MNEVHITLKYQPGASAGSWHAAWSGTPIVKTYPDGHTCYISVMSAYGDSPAETLVKLSDRLTRLGIITGVTV